jgi:hypothetical protein
LKRPAERWIEKETEKVKLEREKIREEKRNW